MSKQVTMRDIARELNISAVSVSKAISGKEGVSDEVREKIIAKANEMGYEYSQSKELKAPHFNIGVIVSRAYISDNAFYSKLFQNIAMEFGKEGHSCTLMILSRRDEEEANLPLAVYQKEVDGLVVLGPLNEKTMNRVLRIDIATVFVDNYTAEANMDCVVSDNLYGSHMLTNYLIEKGHKRIAFVGSVTQTHSIMDRYLGYIKSLMLNNRPILSEYVLEDRDSKGLFEKIKMPDIMPDAFVCNCDEVALRLIEQLKSMGKRVPEDISVVGFDDYIFAMASTPKLTTFRVDMDQMSKCAVKIMEEKLKGAKESSGRRVISGEIVIRDSVSNKRKQAKDF